MRVRWGALERVDAWRGRFGGTEGVAALLAAGASPNARDKVVLAAGQGGDGFDLLHRVQRGQDGVTRMESAYLRFSAAKTA